MCDLYDITTAHETFRHLFPQSCDMTNRVDPQLDVYPNYPAPALRNLSGSEHELTHLRWGMQTPPIYVKGEAAKPLHWFAHNEEKPLFAFTGIWTTWDGARKKKEGPVEDDIFAFLTTEPNAVVMPVHPKAMPVSLCTVEEIDTWSRAPWNEPKQMQKPLPDADLIDLTPSNDNKEVQASLF
ncbi:SOS response-associated peptidase family protein [Ochrobactrum sp. BTU1]|uniref:SOS response-associated peptidase family protein n=1 Tax=Ochrobactrum sp. BTU1 TaxID=2840456 RepID=UPI001C04B000|nr:SOS response-associated peptidase family protein [Ochrobactrum sp. BTU1]